jgi:hypothetical protein
MATPMTINLKLLSDSSSYSVDESPFDRNTVRRTMVVVLNYWTTTIVLNYWTTTIVLNYWTTTIVV